MPVIWDSLRRYRFSKLPALSQVPRVENPSWDVFSAYFVAQGAPVVITDSPVFADRAVTVESMMTASDAREIHVNVRSGNYLTVEARRQDRMQLSAYVEKYIRPSEKDGPEDEGSRSLPRYAGNTPLTHEQFAALGFRAPQCFGNQNFAAPRLWFGPKGSATPLHYDGRDNLICQYIGRKHLTLYPPGQIRWLYTRDKAPAWSLVADPRRPDLDKFPLFARAKGVEVTLNAGELLYLPARWSHFVRNLDVSVMVNFWPEYTKAQAAKVNFVTGMRRVRTRLVRLTRV